MTSIFEGQPPPKQGLFQSKQGSFGFQVYIYIYTFLGSVNLKRHQPLFATKKNPHPGNPAREESNLTLTQVRTFESTTGNQLFVRSQARRKSGRIDVTQNLKLTEGKAPENRPGPNRKVVFQPSIFRGYVSFREGKKGSFSKGAGNKAE